MDASGRVRAVNAAFLALVDREPNSVLGLPLGALLAEEEVFQLLGVESLLREPTMQDSSILFSMGDGSPRALLVSFTRGARDQDTLLVVRAPGPVRTELEDASRWIAAEQERALELRAANDALAIKNRALLAAQGQLETAYATLQAEVVERQRLERELALSHKLEAVGQLAAGLAHEINTPMQYIGDNLTFFGAMISQFVGYVEDVRAVALRVDTTPAGQAALEEAAERADLEFALVEGPKALESLLAGVDQVAKIVRAVKAFAQADHTGKSAVDINEALLDTLVVAKSEYRSVATVETDLGELPPVSCVLGAINQVFLALIVNAAHAIAERGRAGPGTIRIRSRATPGHVEISISDDGCGIPPEIRHRIFDPFFSTKPLGRGTGHGLSTARTIVVEGHAGTIDFESVVGQGTTFVICLPSDPLPRQHLPSSAAP